MELEDKYENLLIEIIDSKDEKLEGDYVEGKSKNERPELMYKLQFLIESELVEFDETDNAYYLTYEGYEEAEGISELRKAGEEITGLEFQHMVKNSRSERTKTIIGSAGVILIVILLLYGLKSNPKQGLTPDLLQQIKHELSFKMDSIINEEIVSQINKSWNWSGIIADTIIATNEFGNVIFKDKKQEIYRICPEELSLEKIASNQEEYEIIKTKDNFIFDWEMNNLVQLAKAKVGELGQFEKFCLIVPAVISSDYSKENIAKIPFEELIAVSGDLAFQIKDLEDGQKIELKIKN